MKKMLKDKKELIIILAIILLVILLGVAGTMAWFTWSSQNNTSLTMQIGDVAEVTYDMGPDINTENLAPVFNYYDGEKTTFSIKNKSLNNEILNYKITLNIRKISAALQNKNFKYKLFTSGSSDVEVANGNFSVAKANDEIILYSSSLNPGTIDYKFYLYIDGNDENDLAMMNSNFQASLTVKV